MKIANCLSCDAEIKISQKIKIGQYVFCDVCGADFEIAQLNPIALDYTFIDDEYDDDDDDDSFDSPVYDGGGQRQHSRW